MTAFALPPATIRTQRDVSPDAPQHRVLRELLWQRVPELADGVIEIVAIARERGIGAKVAVRSTTLGITADGACIGLHGQRIRDVERLAGERVGIIRFHPNPCRFAANALRVPVLSVSANDRGPRRITITVAPEHLSRALGKGGWNVRLAVKLTGWAITVCTPQERPVSVRP